MTNPWRGEVSLVINGQSHVMRLTLGVLAELEAQLGESSLLALVERFETGGFSSSDVMALLVAGLRGGGWAGNAETFLTAQIEGGPMGAARAAAALLANAFMLPETA